jgi:hypothetical protein
MLMKTRIVEFSELFSYPSNQHPKEELLLQQQYSNHWNILYQCFLYKKYGFQRIATSFIRIMLTFAKFSYIMFSYFGSSFCVFFKFPTSICLKMILTNCLWYVTLTMISLYNFSWELNCTTADNQLHNTWNLILYTEVDANPNNMQNF